MFSEHRDMAAAQTFFVSAKMVTGVTPDRVTPDGPDSYSRAIWTTVCGIATANISITGWSKNIAVSKAAMVRCAGSSAHDRLADFAKPTTSCVTFSVPAPEPGCVKTRDPVTEDVDRIATRRRPGMSG
jgi:hypothetical protein